ncbi:MAG TPA: chemotaxis protein CheA, partial [Desulfobacterales bacterium]|nr:chemotaxis protein CheA [Desulfobacterales bacterium]
MESKAEYREAFGEESRENLQEWEQALLALECDPADREQLNRLFRCIHTLKGSAGFLGFTEFAAVAHVLESRLADVREGTRAFDAALVDRLFAGLDLSRGLVEDFLDGKPPGRDAAGFLRRLEEMDAAPAPVTPPTVSAEHDPTQVPSVLPAAPVPATTPAEDVSTLRIVLCIQGQGREPLLRLALAQARLRRIGTLLSLDPPQEQLRVSNGRLDVTATFRTARTDEEVRAALNVDQVDVTGLSDACDDPSPAGGVAVAAVRASIRSEEVVRVSVAKLDALLNLVGELVIQNSGFLSAAQQLGVEIGRVRAVLDLEERTEALGRVVRNLQDGIMKARMLPVATVFERFHRVVRDLAKVGGKTVGLEISGEETEIDKKVIDRIGEPLVHLVRNAVDHGLEPAAERLAAGKSAEGVVRLGAFQEGDHICIEVADDGRGLDRDAIVRKAVEKGLVAPAEAAAATTERIHSLIFLPGFSTAREVSDISGRGVGMDVVKRVVDEMNGSVRVRSTPGRGTAITIAVPLTTAIISAVLVEVGSAMFAVPLSTVREITRTGPGNLGSVGRHRVLRLREDVLALIHLNDALGVGAAGAPDARDRGGRPALVVEHEGRRICLEVDRIEGAREIVIKSLSRNYREVEGLIGATILGTGRIALIVDAEALIRRF